MVTRPGSADSSQILSAVDVWQTVFRPDCGWGVVLEQCYADVSYVWRILETCACIMTDLIAAPHARVWTVLGLLLFVKCLCHTRAAIMLFGGWQHCLIELVGCA